MRSERVLVVVVLLAACNRMLGIDDVVRDTDGDGHLDDVDNCPDIFNPAQFDVCPCEPNSLDADADGVDDGCDECIGPGPQLLDSGGNGIDDGCEPCAAATGTDADQDGVDDACDVCSLGAPHDEDGDVIEDSCDVCPGVPNPQQQINDDADFIGDICDPLSSPEVSNLFDAFVTLAPHWQPLPTGWSVSGDALVVSTQTRGLLLLSTDVPRRTSIETRWDGSGDAGIVISNATQRVSCTIDETNTLRLQITPPTTVVPITVAGSGPRRLRFHSQPFLSMGQFSYACDVLFDDGTSTGVALDDQNGLNGQAGVIASGVGKFEYFWQLTTLD